MVSLLLKISPSALLFNTQLRVKCHCCFSTPITPCINVCANIKSIKVALALSCQMQMFGCGVQIDLQQNCHRTIIISHTSVVPYCRYSSSCFSFSSALQCCCQQESCCSFSLSRDNFYYRVEDKQTEVSQLSTHQQKLFSANTNLTYITVVPCLHL